MKAAKQTGAPTIDTSAPIAPGPFPGPIPGPVPGPVPGPFPGPVAAPAPGPAPVVAPAPAPQPAAFQAPPVAVSLLVPPPAVSPAVNPTHYNRFTIQPIEFCRVNNLMFWQANVVKYVCRADAKNGVEDIEKAIDYLMKERAFLVGDPKWMDVVWTPPSAQPK